MKKYLLIVLFFTFFLIFFSVHSSSVQVKLITPGCGNGIIEPGEACDGSNLGGKTCQFLGFSGGTLSCDPDCTLNTSGCFNIPPGGGGGGAPPLPPMQTKVIFIGLAYPKSPVTLLEDGKVAATTLAGPDARFRIELIDIPPGNYVFTLYTEDKEGRRSNSLTFQISVTAGVTTQVSGIFLPPTIDVDKEKVKRGEPILIFGQTLPQAEVLINISSEKEYFLKTTSSPEGFYSYDFLTEQLEFGSHFVKSRSSKAGEVSAWSRTVSFEVTQETRYKIKKCGRGDLNCDGRVNLIDFSIAAYWYKKRLSPAFAKIEKERLNGDGKVDLVDFSIMAYYWTG
jgi:hypothetical protein